MAVIGSVRALEQIEETEDRQRGDGSAQRPGFIINIVQAPGAPPQTIPNPTPVPAIEHQVDPAEGRAARPRDKVVAPGAFIPSQ